MWKRIEWLIVLFVIIFYAGLLTPSEVSEGGYDVIMDKVSVIVQAIVIPLTAFVVLVRWRQMVAAIRVCKLPVAVSLLLLASTFWSIDRTVSLRRALIFFFATLISVYVGGCLTRARQIHLYAVMSLVSVIACFTIVAVLPSYGISQDTHLGEWRGVFQHKNALGKQMVFALAVLVGGRAFRSFYLRWATAIGALALLALSRSGTALFGFTALVLGYGLLKLMRIRDRQTLPLWLALAPFVSTCIAIALMFRSEISILVGKDPTLTGRTAIWAQAFRGIAEKPLFGWGYAVYWRQAWIRPYFGATAPNHAHDGFIDIWVDIGLVGVALVAAAIFYYLRFCLKKILDGRVEMSDFSAFAFLYLIVLVALNLGESNLLRYHTFLWTPFVSLYTAMGLQAVSERQNASASEWTAPALEDAELQAV